MARSLARMARRLADLADPFNIFNINSFSSQNVTKQFTIINLWPCFHVINPSVMRYRVWISFYSVWGQPPRIFFLYLLINLFLWKLHWCFKFVCTKRSCNKLRLSAGLFETSKRQKNPWVTKQSNWERPRNEELPLLVEASKIMLTTNLRSNFENPWRMIFHRTRYQPFAIYVWPRALPSSFVSPEKWLC